MLASPPLSKSTKPSKMSWASVPADGLPCWPSHVTPKAETVSVAPVSCPPATSTSVPLDVSPAAVEYSVTLGLIPPLPRWSLNATHGKSMSPGADAPQARIIPAANNA